MSWQVFQSNAMDVFVAKIREQPERFRGQVEGFVTALQASGLSLQRSQVMLRRRPEPALTARWRQLHQRHVVLLRGLGWGAETVGAAPVGVVVAGAFVGLAGMAWALAAYQYATNLREETALLENELQARIAAGSKGRMLQPSTLKPAPGSGAGPDGKVLGLAAVALVGVGAWALWR